ncbi:MAG: ribulokinase, partial [Lentisphaeria bacterium]|nr:ribulokinase [Lentisphaeria bacterium]
RPGVLLKSVGTSGSDLLVAAKCYQVVPGICGQAEGTILPGAVALEAGQAAVGDVFAWFRRLLEYSGGKVDLKKLESDAAKLRDTAEQVAAIDFFAGRRTPFCDPKMAGALTGLTLGSSAPEVYLALQRAVAFGTRSIFDNYRANGLEINEVRVIGGVAVKSQLLRELTADALQMDVKLVDQEQCCALGAAMFAAVACGLHEDLPGAQRAMAPGIRSVTHPDPARRELSERLYRRYLELVAFEERRVR